MFQHSLAVLAVIVVAFAVAKKLKVSTELSMLLASVAAIIAHVILPMGEDPRSPLPFVEIIRHFVEGGVTYFDVCLLFLSATLFMSLYNKSGGVTYIVRLIVDKFSGHRFVLLLLLTAVMLVPGAVTGSGATTVLTVGGLVGTVLMAMGIDNKKIIALIFLLSAMSAACPPVNLWAMMAAAGANMPFVGFTAPLAILSIAGALFSTFFLAGRGGKAIDKEDALNKLEKAPEGWNAIRAVLPFVVMIGLLICCRVFVDNFPVLGQPMIFMLSALTVILVSPKKFKFREIMDATVETVYNLRGLVGIMVVVGILNQIMTLSGARGLLSLLVVTLPIAVLFGTLWLILPVAEGVLQYAVAPLFGVPLIMLFNMLGYNPVIALSTWAVMLPLGDCLPPTRVVGTATVQVMEGILKDENNNAYKCDYYKDFVKTALIPMLFTLALCTVAMIFNVQFGALLGG